MQGPPGPAWKSPGRSPPQTQCQTTVDAIRIRDAPVASKQRSAARVRRAKAIDPHEELRPVDLGLTEAECDFLRLAIGQWSGPASATDDVAVLCGFDDSDAMYDGLQRIANGVGQQWALSRLDWRRAILATELVFGSDTHGAGVEWEIVTGRDDCESLGVLRELQRKLVGVCRSRLVSRG